MMVLRQWLLVIGAMALTAMLCLGQGLTREVETPEGKRHYFFVAPEGDGPAPLLVFLHGEEQASEATMQMYVQQWSSAVARQGWHVVLPWAQGQFGFHSEEGVRAVRAVLRDYARRHRVDAQRVYLAGYGDGAPGVFAVLSRLPAVWGAALAIGGDANRAIDTNRIYAGNIAHIPLLWLYEETREPVLRGAIRRMQYAGLTGHFQPANEFRAEQAVEWLSQHRRAALPSTVDYETGSLEYPQAHWVEIREFDFAQRNDVLASTRVDPGTGAFLRLGGFGYDPEGQGPGVPVKWLPPNYKGPLKLEDCIVSIAGKMVQDAAHYAEIMETQQESRDVGIILRRSGKNMRIETRIVIPKRDESETARILAEYLEATREVLVVSRGVKTAMLRISESWAPVKISWNGTDLETQAKPGCWLLEIAPPARLQQKHAAGDGGPVARPVPCDVPAGGAELAATRRAPSLP